MRWATLDPDGRPTGFYSSDVHPELFEQADGEPRPRGQIAGAVPVTEADWQELLSHPGRRKLQGGRVVATEPPALPATPRPRPIARSCVRPCSETSSRPGSSSAPPHLKASRPRR